ICHKRCGREHSRVDGGLPMFDAERISGKKGIGETRNIADCHDTGLPTAAQVCVCQHTIPEVQVVAREPVGVGHRAHSLQYEVSGQFSTVIKSHSFDSVPTKHLRDALTHVESDPSVLVT